MGSAARMRVTGAGKARHLAGNTALQGHLAPPGRGAVHSIKNRLVQCSNHRITRANGDDYRNAGTLHCGRDVPDRSAGGARLQARSKPGFSVIEVPIRTARSSLFHSIATLRMLGRATLSSSRRLVLSVVALSDMPVRLPPGRAKLTTKPLAARLPQMARDVAASKVR
jgi:hypothetical protein